MSRFDSFLCHGESLGRRGHCPRLPRRILIQLVSAPNRNDSVKLVPVRLYWIRHSCSPQRRNGGHGTRFRWIERVNCVSPKALRLLFPASLCFDYSPVSCQLAPHFNAKAQRSVRRGNFLKKSSRLRFSASLRFDYSTVSCRPAPRYQNLTLVPFRAKFCVTSNPSRSSFSGV